MPHLFDPLQLGPLTLANRIAIAPMCQYSATEGTPGDWHMIHLGSLALSGAGLLIIEATAVEPQGRITSGDLGLYSDANEAGLARVLAAMRAHAPIKVAIQLGHAGRKASSRAPWDGGLQVRAGEPGGRRVRQSFADAARRAARLGLDGIELHGAHGYLLHQFLSPLANQRTDAYGGSLENRMRFPLEVFDAVREAFTPDKPVWMRISATDWVAGGWDLDSSVALSHALKARGCSAIHVSSGGASPQQQIPLGPNYQVPFAQRIKAEVGLPTLAVGLITEPEQANAIVASGDADAVSIGRAMLYNPRWPWHAAAALSAQVTAPPQYWRSQPREYQDLFTSAHFGAR
jgi:2,4-dienoyl-CoA reductase-like NADH-dependent reductase (Old Yellow Enzyme family)